MIVSRLTPPFTPHGGAVVYELTLCSDGSAKLLAAHNSRRGISFNDVSWLVSFPKKERKKSLEAVRPAASLLKCRERKGEVTDSLII